MLGIDRPAFEGQDFSVLWQHLPGINDELKTAISERSSISYAECERTTSSGEALRFGLSGTHLRDDAGRCIGTALFVHEVTELHRLRSRLEDNKRLAALGEMAGGLAHQIRNSLGAISGYGTLLKRRLAKAELPNEPARELLDETRQAEELVGRFLDFARPAQLDPEPTDMNELIRDVIRVTESRFREASYLSGDNP